MRNLLIFLIELYQKTLSPDHGPLKGLHPYGFCRHEPTCSEYGKKVIAERGAAIGSLMTIKRILSCNPFVKPSDEKLRKLIAKASQ
ncbi:membrane protein insertion efficiency factor YidD [Candidatus Peribacteria bacterium]|nr:membrane protein insertion efficiency factor YidD [Candidatus Peribacteria bacterium]